MGFFKATSIFLTCCLSVILWSLGAAQADSEKWLESKGQHFIIYFYPQTDTSRIDFILSQADNYYQQIAIQIGYSRYQNFWSWDNRVKIYIYPDSTTFVKKTGQPEWSKGGAVAYHPNLKSKVIISYDQQDDFIYNVLPHEIGHLTLKDFVREEPLPLWVEEGVAQFLERDKVKYVHAYMKKRIQENDFVAFKRLNRYDIRQEMDPEKVQLYYAQSLSLIDFLIKNYGSLRFGRMCRRVRDGTAFDQAFLQVYKPEITSFSALEKKWLRYVNGQ
ncbi:MAG: hypothetical protein K8S27_01440 [Candidatus Omnitrophica bacterium]|nr:hypothetical protein [Candidatus Omnitrophota bacterium]